MKPASVFKTSLLATLVASSGLDAQIILQFTNGKDFLQTGPESEQVDFRRGLLNINLRDGSATRSYCSGQPLPYYIVGGIYIDCPLGTNAYIATGDSDGDGYLDDTGFISLSALQGGVLIEPFEEELASLVAAPQSKLPRPYSNFQDQSWSLFYDLHTAEIYQYVITEYDSDRVYGSGDSEWQRIDQEVVSGQYVFSFPMLDNENQAVPLAVTYREIPEGPGPHHRYPKRDFRFTGGTWDSNGFRLIDPDLGELITWQGNDITNVFPGVDVQRVMVLDRLTESDPSDPMKVFDLGNYDTRSSYEDLIRAEIVDGEAIPDNLGFGNDGDQTAYLPYFDEYLPIVLFPPSRVPLLLPSVYDQSFDFPPGFFEPGQRRYFTVRFDRTLGTSEVAYDTSVRMFHMPVRFVSTYASFQTQNFASDADASLTKSGADFDGDGASNIAEMALGTDPTDDTDVPAQPGPQPNDDGTVTFTYTLAADVYLQDRLVITDLSTGKVWKVGRTNADWTVTRVTDVEVIEDPITDTELSPTVVTVTVQSKDAIDPANLTAYVDASPLTLD
ncbi:hypothetical protein HNR46_002138 [Haloferula luteola]|uniref:Uncharacterized protein n=1 Tax=Haloferula luteola TaxID=595692 RepID=A0A840VDJ9_9BACT|nr:hypothetical protein [Haloferula luteola]MBB5351899.1 hypothetical protein [Haloferula luteola]